MKRGNGQRRGFGRGMGQCPQTRWQSCGHKGQHVQGVSCMDNACPKCGSIMNRELNK